MAEIIDQTHRNILQQKKYKMRLKLPKMKIKINTQGIDWVSWKMLLKVDKQRKYSSESDN